MNRWPEQKTRTFPQVLRHWAETQPDKDALIYLTDGGAEAGL